MTDTLIESTIILTQSCLLKGEQEKFYNFVNYRGEFSLRNEMGTCSNIEVDLQVIDISLSHIVTFLVLLYKNYRVS